MDLTSKRLQLLEISEAYIPHIHKLNSYPEVAKFNTIGIPDSLDVTSSLLQTVIFDRFKETRSVYAWALFIKKSDTFVGEIGMQVSAEKYNRAEIHYNLIPGFWGKGFATEGVKAVIDYGFNTLNLHRIEAGVAVDNHGSVKVLEKVGMLREGRKRKILPLQSGWSDNYMYAVLKTD